MKQRDLGPLRVPAIGLGCMRMSAYYGATDEREALATINRALELGCNFLDTAEMYGPHANEELVGRAVAGRRDDLVVATKFERPVRRAGSSPRTAASRTGQGRPARIPPTRALSRRLLRSVDVRPSHRPLHLLRSRRPRLGPRPGTGQDERIDPGELARLWDSVELFGDAIRSEGTCGPALDPPPDAGEQTRLLAHLGRRA